MTCKLCHKESDLVRKSYFDKEPSICPECKHERSIRANKRYSLILKVKADPEWLERARQSELKIAKRFKNVRPAK